MTREEIKNQLNNLSEKDEKILQEIVEVAIIAGGSVDDVSEYIDPDSGVTDEDIKRFYDLADAIVNSELAEEVVKKGIQSLKE